MGYAFQEREPVETAVRRIATELIDEALSDLDNARLDGHLVTHEVRKRTKKLRALLRLVRPRLGATYAAENACFRDAAQTLSDLRDATALIETYDALMTHYAGAIDRRAFGPIRRALTFRRRRIASGARDLDERLGTFRNTMVQARDRVQTWTIGADEFEALSGGLERTYGRGRKAMIRAYADRTPESFHTWRKRVKDHWYHMTLLLPLWPGPMTARCEALDLLADLAVLRGTLLGDADGFGNPRHLQAFIALLDRRAIALRAQAHPLGLRIFAESRGQMGRRCGRIWRAWRIETGEVRLQKRRKRT